MRHHTGEQDHAYVLRVEQQRRALGIEAGTVYHAFVHCLGMLLRMELDAICFTHKAAQESFSW